MRSHDLLAEAQSLPRHESERLLAAATDRSRSEVIVGFDVTDAEAGRFLAYVQRRNADEPLQYIEGSVPFGQVVVSVDDRVLVPRPETEYLLELLVARLETPLVIVDLCTGSGNLALGLKSAFPAAVVHGTDLSASAIEVARRNAALNDLDVCFHVGDLFDPLPTELRGNVDLLVANPPYLAVSEVADLPADVLKEPRTALVAGDRGDEIIERIGAEVSSWLAPSGLVACEVSEFHARTVTELFGGVAVSVVEDLTGRDRFVLGVLDVE